MKKKRVLIIAIVFFTSSFLVWTSSRQEYSKDERRKLKQRPELTLESVMNGNFQNNFELYIQDQFPQRYKMREVKAHFRYYGLNVSENNNYYIDDGKIIKMEYPLKENEIIKAAQLLNKIQATYLEESEVYYSIIFDKSYYSSKKNVLKMDYEHLESIFVETMSKGEYIDLKETISLKDFYNTDIHWKQENLNEVSRTILKAMSLTPSSNYNQHIVKDDFIGVYEGHSALKVQKDSISSISNKSIENASVTLLNAAGKQVYDMDNLNHMDPYDYYLHGPQAIVTIENKYATDNRELIIFRDSFASSLTPYFINNYSKITLVDLRYISPKILGDSIDFNGQDVLFILSTSILNNSSTLKDF